MAKVIDKAIDKVIEDFKRLYFVKSHELEIAGAKMGHAAGRYYHVGLEHVDELVAKGIALIDDGVSTAEELVAKAEKIANHLAALTREATAAVAEAPAAIEHAAQTFAADEKQAVSAAGEVETRPKAE